MTDSPQAGDGLTVATIKSVFPHYTDAQAEAHLAAHQSFAPARAMVAGKPIAPRVQAALSSIVAIIAATAR